MFELFSDKEESDDSNIENEDDSDNDEDSDWSEGDEDYDSQMEVPKKKIVQKKKENKNIQDEYEIPSLVPTYSKI